VQVTGQSCELADAEEGAKKRKNLVPKYYGRGLVEG